MKKFKIIFSTEENIDGKWESMSGTEDATIEAESVPRLREAEKLLEENVFAYFNSTLKPGEHERRLEKIVSIEFVPEPEPEEDDDIDEYL